jgi:hypothetical protein
MARLGEVVRGIAGLGEVRHGNDEVRFGSARPGLVGRGLAGYGWVRRGEAMTRQGNYYDS